jgi:hypothetical protein
VGSPLEGDRAPQLDPAWSDLHEVRACPPFRPDPRPKIARPKTPQRAEAHSGGRQVGEIAVASPPPEEEGGGAAHPASTPEAYARLLKQCVPTINCSIFEIMVFYLFLMLLRPGTRRVPAARAPPGRGPAAAGRRAGCGRLRLGAGVGVLALVFVC